MDSGDNPGSDGLAGIVAYDASTLTIAANTTVEGHVVAWGYGTYGESGCMTPTLNVYGAIDTTDVAADNEAIWTSENDDSQGAINGGLVYGTVTSEDGLTLIPSTSTALFSESESDALAEGCSLVEDSGNPGLYKVLYALLHNITVSVENGTIGTNAVAISAGS